MFNVDNPQRFSCKHGTQRDTLKLPCLPPVESPD